MRPYPLGSLSSGINRLKVKGGASGRQLYDLLNGYIDQEGSVQPREGTIRFALLDATTVGLCSMDGIFNVFATTLETVPTGFKCNVLINPNNTVAALSKIWFAKPFMGFLYVVAQFADGSVVHYWLQSGGSWVANTVYFNGNIVEPTTPNGLAYLATRNSALNPNWAAQTTVTLNELIEPTEYTGFAYKAISVLGSAPHTGDVEPSWPTVEAGTVQEFGDFGVTSSASGTSSAATNLPLGTNITDRYGNSETIAGQTGTASSGNAVTVTAASAVTTWAAGTTYAPGAVVKPSTGQGAFIGAIPNGDFENGDDGSWTTSASIVYDSSHQYQGNFCLAISCNHGRTDSKMTSFGVVTPGQSVTASTYVNPNATGSDLNALIALAFYDASDTFISKVDSSLYENPGYRQISVTAVAPATAAHCRVWLSADNGTSTRTAYFDLVVWNLETPAAVSNFLYEAVQSVAGSSGTTEPTWPVISGNTVIDNQVTWKAIGTSIITWQAVPLMKSGGSEPSWPVTPGLTVHDGTMSWQCITRAIGDTNCPQNIPTAISSSHIFNGNVDICSYSAAVDPTDWSSANNAGYLPTGLNNYGDNPIAVLALYRSNLVVFNSGGYQMWQTDADPANNALLDAQPVGSIYPRAAQSVANDLLFLTEVGVRNLSTIGGTANMAIGNTGQPVDPIVKARLKAGLYSPISLYYPGRGQYWLIFGPEALVFTANGTGLKTWSRYVFPEQITDWTLNSEVLYLRSSGNKIWQLDADTLVDDFGGTPVVFNGLMQWPYLDLSSVGFNKMLVGVDLIGDGQVTIQIGFNQNDPTTFSDNPGFATSLNVTAPYTIAIGDTLYGEPIPIPVNAPSYTLILTFTGNQAWDWQFANLYLGPVTPNAGGSTG